MVGGNVTPICSDLSIFVGTAAAILRIRSHSSDSGRSRHALGDASGCRSRKPETMRNFVATIRATRMVSTLPGFVQLPGARPLANRFV
ncbi:hypothetical protein BLA15816_01799 [Burkholderia lata]|uniref:Uncharacterized protein n=1 Tax=Burkholderia lata (strain ATCC 17760 / DSM 23089 / LMG 22485 / NCIMB 9086 / R18194 / 383) TaxID=482957 RepID=A0A6P2KEM8_BURL3|nr:hypothetical protein BLA15816_01799 [Burkholderia lata]VWB53857.1 hypothetical protein BLA15945_02515 [Burkholderia lata]